MVFSACTLGCKLNQLETEAIIDSFTREGFQFVPWEPVEHGSAEPWIFVINTCTVTSMAEQKARRVIRKALRDYPGACLIVTGCYAQVESAALTSIQHGSIEPQRLFVIPGEIKDRIMDLPRFLNESLVSDFHFDSSLPGLIAAWLASPQEPEDGAFRFRPYNYSAHSRGFLKIQDGCDSRCAYCRVSIARGKSRSLGSAEVLKDLASLEDRGFAEAVLTGVNITQYRGSGLGLTELLDFLLNGTDKIMIRLSSIEPDLFTRLQGAGGFIRILANKRIRPHFHLSVQSGSLKTLEKMGRAYSPADIEMAVEKIRSVREDPFLACDIIAGFPGETDREFAETLELCERTGFAWIHAFPFSLRPGTAACDFPERVGAKQIKRRVELLTELGQRGRSEYLSRWIGREVEAVVEAGPEPGFFVPALSENYLKLLISCRNKPAPRAGTAIRCRILPKEAVCDSSPLRKYRQFDTLAELTQ